MSTSNSKTVLSLDLSLNCTGWAVVKITGIGKSKQKVTVIDKGHINNKNFTKRSQAYRLHRIFKELRQIYLDHPEVETVVKERGFSRGMASTQALFKVAGVADVVSFGSGFDSITEYPPVTIKKEVGGHGKASKEEVETGVRNYLDGTDITFATDDESDAVAVAICYFLKQGDLDKHE